MSKKQSAEAITNLRASDKMQVALVVNAKIGGEPVDLFAEKIGASWKFGWIWDLGEKTLDDVVKTLRPQWGELPKGIGCLKPHRVHAEFALGDACTGLSFGIGDLSFVHVSAQTEQRSATCWGLVHEKPIDIPITGVVAALLGKQLTLSNLRVGSVSGKFDEAQRADVAAQFSQLGLLLGEGSAAAEGFVAGVAIQGLGASPIELPFRVASSPPGVSGSEPKTPPAPTKPDASTVPTSVDDSKGMRKWFPVNKSIGPLRLGRVGCEWHGDKIGLLLDAAIDTGALRLGLTGLAIRLPPSDPRPANLEVGLDGIDVAYRGGAVTISGGLYKSESTTAAGKTVQYDGAVLLKAADLVITGLGSYASVGGAPSLFIFAALHKELGGPPCFRVNGLAAGFGYNRKLKLPSIEEVESFPLVRAALDENYLTSNKSENPIQAAMRLLRDYIPPAIGEYWFSVGIRFNSFEMIQAAALLSVSFGTDLTLSILGLATLTVPPRLPKAVVALCYAELALRAEFSPSVGVLSVQARLTSNSYIFDKACKLTGGFAFFTWFRDKHAGDFVITLGGYHPKFSPPEHYPIVPRVGVDWIVSPQLRVTGQLYFAITPSCLMAGGRLAAVYDGGWVKAWFVAYADFIIGWKPFHYDIAIGVSIGASATVGVDLGLFTVAKTFTFEIGANLHLWGPPFSGEARVKFYVVSFTLRFGDQGKPVLKPIRWADFKGSFLPESTRVCSIACTDGLLQEWKSGEISVAIVNGHELALSIQTQVPCTVIRWDGVEVKPSTSWKGELGVAPMFAGDLESELNVTLTRDTGEIPGPELSSLFSLEVLRKGFPDALWGKGKPKLDTPTSRVLEEVPAGLLLRLSESGKHAKIRHSLPTMALQQFGVESSDNKAIPWARTSFPKGIVAPGENTLHSTIWGNTAVNQYRARVIKALADVTPYPLNEIALSETAAKAERIFQAKPTFAELGQLLPEEK